MGDFFPEDPQLTRFSHRYSSPTFDPTIVRHIISPATQSKPKGMLPMPPMPMTPASAPMPVPMPMPVPVPAAIPTIEERPVHMDAAQYENGQNNINSPRPPPAAVHISNSPKRPYMPDESDGEQPRKIARGESPLKGAAGRRLDAARRNQARAADGSSHLNVPQAMQPPSLPREVMFLLSIIPGAQTYRETRFNAERMVALLRNIDVNPQASSAPTPPPARSGPIGGPPPPSMLSRMPFPPSTGFNAPPGMPPYAGELPQFNLPVYQVTTGMTNLWTPPGYPYPQR
jgi:cleavage stimulation factor subunit 3